MKITKEWLREYYAYQGGYEWFCEQTETNSINIIQKLIKEDYFDWANWLITKILNKKQNVMYAVYAAELVLHIYENRYPDDKRPRKAIEAAKNYLSDAADAAYAAYAAADAAYAAYAVADDAADDAAYAAHAAAYAAAADDAAYAAYAAADDAAHAAAYAAYAAADDAAYAAADAAAADDAADDADIRTKIIGYGIKLIKEGEDDGRTTRKNG
jgi:hypothetical protein